jgi:hypothetical protein
MHRILSFINITLSHLYLLHYYFAAKLNLKSMASLTQLDLVCLGKNDSPSQVYGLRNDLMKRCELFKRKMFSKMEKHFGYHRCYLERDGVDALVWVT